MVVDRLYSIDHSVVTLLRTSSGLKPFNAQLHVLFWGEWIAASETNLKIKTICNILEILSWSPYSDIHFHWSFMKVLLHIFFLWYQCTLWHLQFLFPSCHKQHLQECYANPPLHIASFILIKLSYTPSSLTGSRQNCLPVLLANNI